jgi:hypothetical protein
VLHLLRGLRHGHSMPDLSPIGDEQNQVILFGEADSDAGVRLGVSEARSKGKSNLTGDQTRGLLARS